MNGLVRPARYRVVLAVAGMVSLSLLTTLLPTNGVLFAQEPGATDAGQSTGGNLASEDSPLLLEPKTPDEMFDAVVVLTDLARPKLAADYLSRLVQSNPSDDAILRMRQKHGPAAFLRLANLPQMQPSANILLDRMNSAYEKWVSDPGRIGELINELQAGPRAREAALLQLRSAGASVIPPMVTLLLDTSQKARNDVILNAILRMGSDVVPPLLASLDAPDDDFKSAMIDLLGGLGSSEAVPHLWYYAFSENQPSGVGLVAKTALSRILQAPAERVARVSAYGVERELRRQAVEYLAGDHPWELTDSGMVSLWVWSPEAKTVVLRQVPPKSAELYLAARFARQALEIAPDSSANQTVYLGILLEDAAYEAGANRPLPAGPGTAHDLALLAGSEVVLETLAHSLRQSRPATAVACLQVLSQIATQGEMRLKFPKESRVLSAINYPDRRVQFAAASTILQADPTEPFRGASRVVEVLARVLSDRGQARGVVIDPNVDRAGRVAGFMNDLGYDSGIALTGMEGFRSVAERNDVELIAVHVGVVEWGLNQTIANLKADARTAGIPIVIYGSQMLRAKLEPLAARYPQVAYIIESSSSGDFASQVRPFREKFSSPALTPEQRHEQRLAAAYWLSHIASGSRTRVFNVQPAEETLVAVTSDPELAISALVTLAAIPTVTAQQTMFEVAVNRNQTADIREVAALQLAFHVQKHGLLLAAQAVDDIHASWRAATDPRVSTALAGVIGSLQPNPTLVGDRLRAFPPRVTPTVP